MSHTHVGVMLMTYGSPATLDDIPAYIKNVYGGREPDAEVVTEFRRRYALIGGSPLIRITQEQAQALEAELNTTGDGTTFHVTAGMRFSPPFIADMVPETAAGAQTLVGIIMSPQYSPIIMNGYISTLEQAFAELHRDDIQLKISRDWHLQSSFLDAVSDRVQQALAKLPEDVRDTTPVLLTAHSMPKRVIENEPDYINHLKETAAEIARRHQPHEGDVVSVKDPRHAVALVRDLRTSTSRQTVLLLFGRRMRLQESISLARDARGHSGCLRIPAAAIAGLLAGHGAVLCNPCPQPRQRRSFADRGRY